MKPKTLDLHMKIQNIINLFELHLVVIKTDEFEALESLNRLNLSQRTLIRRNRAKMGRTYQSLGCFEMKSVWLFISMLVFKEN